MSEVNAHISPDGDLDPLDLGQPLYGYEEVEANSQGVSEVLRQLSASLPDIATNLVRSRPDAFEPVNQSFAAQPDNPSEHAEMWHQYGILTHSYEFGRVLREDVPGYLREWGVADPVNAALDVEIDGVPKRDLLQVVSLVHDVGKFTARTLKHHPETGAVSMDFTGHESHSGDIVRGVLSAPLERWGLTESQIEYIATCAALHFELGKVRRASKAYGGYTVAFTTSPVFAAATRQILDENAAFAPEIGLEFIADSLSKVEVAAISQTDEGIAAEEPVLAAELATRNLNPLLLSQARQQPVNLLVARNYLQQWAA